MTGDPAHRLQRTLKNRHLQMIAIGGAVGTGLFYGSAHVIQLAGPAIILSYAVVGIVIYFIVRALGEMAVHEPVAGSFSYYAYRHWGDFAGFFSGWTYWFCCVAVSMAELAVVGIYVQFWWPSVPLWLTALLCWGLVTAINLTRVKTFGEFEFWSALIKVTAIVLLIVLGTLLIISGLIQGHVPAGLSGLQRPADFFPHGLAGFLLSFAFVIFSFGGVELFGLAAGEVEKPEWVIPRAVRSFVWRILLFYLGSFLVMLTYFPWQNIGLEGSPFVQIFAKSGIPEAASLINLVVISAALSVYNSQLFSNGRMLYNLAREGDAPAAFARLSTAGIPLNAVVFSSLLTLAVVVLNFMIPKKVFLLALSLATVAILMNWSMILITLMKCRRSLAKHGISSPFPMPVYPYSVYGSIAFLIMTAGIMAFVPDLRLSLYIAPVWVISLRMSYHMRRRLAPGSK